MEQWGPAMPIGSYAAIPTIAAEMIRCQPQRVLDLGLGFGMMGVAVRQWIDLGVQPWRTHLVGVEVWEAYRNPLWELYDLLYVRTIEEHLRRDPHQYDLVVLGDVIEHFEEATSHQILNRVSSLLSPGGSILVITPSTEMAQGSAHGNPYERHRSVWNQEKLKQYGYEILLSEEDFQLPPAVPAVVARKTLP